MPDDQKVVRRSEAWEAYTAGVEGQEEPGEAEVKDASSSPSQQMRQVEVAMTIPCHLFLRA